MQLEEKFITLEKVLEEAKQLIEKQTNSVKSKMPKDSMNISKDIQQITDHHLNNTTSKSAILLKILSKDWNMGKLQELLNKKLRKNLELPPITSKLNLKKRYNDTEIFDRRQHTILTKIFREYRLF